MKSSTKYGVTIEQLRKDVLHALCRYFKGRILTNDNLRYFLKDAIIEVLDDKKFRRTDGRDGWMYVFVYDDGAVYVDYNVLDHFKVNDKLVFRWDVCGDDKYMVKMFRFK